MNRLRAVGILLCILAALTEPITYGHAAMSAEQHHSKALNVLLYVNGTVDDGGFFASAYQGIEEAKKQLGITASVVANAQITQWQAQLTALTASRKYDLIILDASDPTLGPALAQLLTRYPKQRFIDFDDNQFASSKNISSIIYRQSQSSFLAGALAAMVADSNKLNQSGKRIVAMVGALKLRVITDLWLGYQQGAQYVDPKIDVISKYIDGSGSTDTWQNRPAGARLAKVLYEQGAAVIYQVAGISGLGVFDQAKATGRYAIGNDSNQDSIWPGHIIGSVVKHVDASLLALIRLDQQGKLQGGHVYYFGLESGSVELTRDAETRKIITPDLYARLDRLINDVIAGKIKVKSAYPS